MASAPAKNTGDVIFVSLLFIVPFDMFSIDLWMQKKFALHCNQKGKNDYSVYHMQDMFISRKSCVY